MVARGARADAAAWAEPALVDAIVHNARHLACPKGFKRVVSRHALTVLERALSFGPLEPQMLIPP